MQRFERFAKAAGWDKMTWATQLSALLTRKVLDVYFRIPENKAGNYDLVKAAILSQYDFTEDGYRNHF